MESLDSKIIPDSINSDAEEEEFKYSASQRSLKLEKLLMVSISAS
jgi:hypothetical protein